MVRVTVSEGILEGQVLDNVLGGKYLSFKGIPYAEPPVGDLRFKAPRPPKKWHGVRSAKDHGPICHQFYVFTMSVRPGSEDCLFLNVYTKTVKPSRLTPVMVFIHGGAFVCGSGNSDLYKPDYLVSKDVVLVTINYRLEILGFLCLDIEEAPGNAGMKDQVAALKWIKKNIHNFGGDPNNVTIFGESAGGASVSMHLVSPMSKGLFKRAILQSGALNSPWVIVNEPVERAKAFARSKGKDTDDVYELLQFFKSQPVEALIAAPVAITFDEACTGLYKPTFSVVIEKNFGNGKSFLHDNVPDVLKNCINEDVEVIVGVNGDEGNMLLGLCNLDPVIENYNRLLQSFVPLDMNWNINIRKQLEVGRKVKEYYYGDKLVSSDNLSGLAKKAGMINFVHSVVQWAKACASKQSKVYFYVFNCLNTERAFFSSTFKTKSWSGRPGVLHGDELMYLFAGEVFEEAPENLKMVDKVTTLWTNLAKFGNPTPDESLGAKWLPFTAEKQEYLDINDTLTLKTFPFREEIQFWERIYDEYLAENNFTKA